uniref:Uncharacterized protein n=1 Tax=Arundo donax TaxID=35708 RepID=A0A0A9GBW0_ARUDO
MKISVISCHCEGTDNLEPWNRRSYISLIVFVSILRKDRHLAASFLLLMLRSTCFLILEMMSGFFLNHL